MNRRTASVLVLSGLLLAVVLAVIVAPSREQGRPYSSYSAGPNGVRLTRDLLDRLGWRPEAREMEFSDTIRDPAPIQVVVGGVLSEREAGQLLAFARRGGSLLLAGGDGSIYDSLGVVGRENGKLAESGTGEHCEPSGPLQAELSALGYAASVGFSRPPPTDTVGFGAIVLPARDNQPGRIERTAVGMAYGRGRIVVAADADILANDVIRRCELQADVEVVRMIEYLSGDRRDVRVAFDEFQHGYGARGGSITAIRLYLSGTPSGRMLWQMAIGGLLLLFAAAPRPLAPRDPTHVARRSPLEHADALAHAYAGVHATRTATARLLAGVRRRAKVRLRGARPDESFLAVASAMSPAAAKAAETVQHALVTPVPERELPSVASALETIEREMTRRPTRTSR